MLRTTLIGIPFAGLGLGKYQARGGESIGGGRRRLRRSGGSRADLLGREQRLQNRLEPRFSRRRRLGQPGDVRSKPLRVEGHDVGMAQEMTEAQGGVPVGKDVGGEQGGAKARDGERGIRKQGGVPASASRAPAGRPSVRGEGGLSRTPGTHDREKAPPALPGHRRPPDRRCALDRGASSRPANSACTPRGSARRERRRGSQGVTLAHHACMKGVGRVDGIHDVNVEATRPPDDRRDGDGVGPTVDENIHVAALARLAPGVGSE